MFSLYTTDIRSETTIVATRQRVKVVAGYLGFSITDQTRLATAVSEIMRNAFQYAQGGKIEFLVTQKAEQWLYLLQVSDEGAGIGNIETILSGNYKSKTGMGMGILGARRLMDYFEIDSAPDKGTTITLGKVIPSHILNRNTLLNDIRQKMLEQPIEVSFQEVWDNNQELLRTLNDLQKQQEELNQLNQKLNDTNQGILVLYTELEEKVHQIQQASDLKTRFISNISHEFRTPLNAMRGLSDMLLNDMSNPLVTEQQKQISYIRTATMDLIVLTNDLLDIAKIEAGKGLPYPSEINPRKLLKTLWEMMDPLLNNPAVNFIVEEPVGVPILYTDEGKLSQILRNLVFNAFKFTQAGEVRLATKLEGERVLFSVVDTGIGITPENQKLIFEEFFQVPHPLQKNIKGTGLGLPLSRNLAELLQGTLSVTSQPESGSTFTVAIPITYAAPLPSIKNILIVDDSDLDRHLLKTFLKGYIIHEAENAQEGFRKIEEFAPSVIFLDLNMPEIGGVDFINDIHTKNIPVIIYTGKNLTTQEKDDLLALGFVAVLSKLNTTQLQIQEVLKQITIV